MTTLYVKSPNETQTDLDLSKIVLRDGTQETPVNTIPVGSTLRFGDRGYIEYRNTGHTDDGKTTYQLLVGNGINTWDGPGARIALHDYRESDGAIIGDNNGNFAIRADNGSEHSDLVGSCSNGQLVWRNASLTDGTFILEKHVWVSTSSSQLSFSIAAPAVSGYKFVAWVMAATDGYVSGGYAQLAWEKNTKYWTDHPANGGVYCTALYVRQW